MRRCLALSVALLAAALAGAAPAGAITFGKLDGNRHRNVGVVGVNLPDGTRDWVCSGTLIAPRVFLTASHCDPSSFIPGVSPDDVFVSFDPTFDPATSPAVEGTFFAHRLFPGPASDPHDIAVIRLDRAVDRTPAQLPAAGLLDRLKARHQLSDRRFTAVGYGTIRETTCCGFNGLIPPDAKRRFALQSALALQGDAWLQLSMNPSTGSGGTCYGDSGGPHFLGGPDSNRIVSITITGDAPCRATDKTYRLDSAGARAFLAQFVPLP